MTPPISETSHKFSVPATIPRVQMDKVVHVKCKGSNINSKIRKKLLCEAGKDFRDKVEAAEAKNPSADSITISVDVDGEIFEVLRRWLQGEPVFCRDKNLGWTEELEKLLIAWTFAKKMMDKKKFQNEVMDEILKLLIDHGEAFSTTKVLPIMLRTFEKDSRGGQLVVDWIVFGELNQNRSQVDDVKDPNLCKMLIATFMEKKLGLRAETFSMTKSSMYHLK